MSAPASSTAAVSATNSRTVRFRAGSTIRKFRRATAKRFRSSGVLVRSSLYASSTPAPHAAAPAPRTSPPIAPDARRAQPRGGQVRGRRHLHVPVRLPVGGGGLDVGGLPALRRVAGVVT